MSRRRIVRPVLDRSITNIALEAMDATELPRGQRLASSSARVPQHAGKSAACGGFESAGLSAMTSRTWNNCIREIAELLEDAEFGLEDALVGVTDPIQTEELLRQYFQQAVTQLSKVEPPNKGPEDMTPKERLDHYRAERERLKFSEETIELVPVEQSRAELAFVVKASVQLLETLPDVLDRDCGLGHEAIARVEAALADARQRGRGEVRKARVARGLCRQVLPQGHAVHDRAHGSSGEP
jgi:hypothetical protein